jgi:DNA replication protein DnaC
MVKETSVHKDLASHLKDLRMPGVRQCYREEAERARKESLSYEAYLLEVVRREAEGRRQNRIERLLRLSQLPREKSLCSFDLMRLPLRLRQQVQVLLEGSFLKRRENVLAFGNPGSGKTHLLCAIAQELIHRGHTVLFIPCSMLVQDLLAAKSQFKLPRLLKRLSKVEALLIDDVGYVQQNREEMEVLFTLLAERYERGSVMLSSNLPFSRWEQIFKDPMTTAAAIDRLVHHCVILELNVKSYRMEKAAEGRRERGEREPSQEAQVS